MTTSLTVLAIFASILAVGGLVGEFVITADDHPRWGLAMIATADTITGVDCLTDRVWVQFGGRTGMYNVVLAATNMQVRPGDFIEVKNERVVGWYPNGDRRFVPMDELPIELERWRGGEISEG